MSRFPNRRWLVIPATEVENVDFNQVLESSADSLRYSIDGSQTFVKYEVTETETEVLGRPSIYSETYTEYNHEEILALLATEAWTAPIDPDLE